SYIPLEWMTPFIWVVFGAGAIYLVYIIMKYAIGLKTSPRELWFVSISQVTEFTAYSIMIMTLTLFLSSDVGMSDVAAGNFMGTWNLSYTILIIGVGSLVDAIGVKKVLVIGTILAIFSRFFLFVSTNFWIVTILGFVPQAVSVAFLSPVISVALKRYTKSDTSAMGFALFYTLMNIGFAFGGLIFDWIRQIYGEYGNVMIPMVGEVSTYRFILFVSFLISFPGMFFIAIMRDGIDLNDEGTLDFLPKKARKEGFIITTITQTAKESFKDAAKIFVNVAKQPAFWKFMTLLAILLGVNYVFYHFHYTFPKYGIRVLGEGAKIGNIYGVLNPAIIVFFVPLIAWLTRKWSSYKMITIGSAISAASVFFVVLPDAFYKPLADSIPGRLIWQEWLAVPEGTDISTISVYLALCLFVIFFTVGEAIWSPRLMEYTAKIAPKGQEGSYLSLSLLPKFISQPLVGFMSGKLLDVYTPATEVINEEGVKSLVVGDISNHYMLWIWVGAVAVISPLGMIIFGKFLRGKEKS
ncbi:MAG TPA: MFS transporter, partial [Bacteroidaceae bacterium]|nr:MFS transporter [Bacteroidaceae bacterium]